MEQRGEEIILLHSGNLCKIKRSIYPPLMALGNLLIGYYQAFW